MRKSCNVVSFCVATYVPVTSLLSGHNEDTVTEGSSFIVQDVSIFHVGGAPHFGSFAPPVKAASCSSTK
jgi:hypothetical protein